MVAPVDRWLALEGLDNIRDVGGLPLREGGTTRTGVLLRSASLRYSTTSDIRHLVEEFGLRLVLDLRTQREIELHVSPAALVDAGVETVALSFIPEEGRELPETEEDVDPLTGIYLGYLRDRAENVVTAVRRLSAAGPTLVHCAAGKDRTGVFVALVLDAASRCLPTSPRTCRGQRPWPPCWTTSMPSTAARQAGCSPTAWRRTRSPGCASG